jgi:hypothetical protein
MMREETVRVRTTDGGAIAFAAGEKYALKIAAGETATEWADGSPITRAEFDAVLAPHGPFELVADPPSHGVPAGPGSSTSTDLSARAPSAVVDASATASATAEGQGS